MTERCKILETSVIEKRGSQIRQDSQERVEVMQRRMACDCGPFSMSVPLLI